MAGLSPSVGPVVLQVAGDRFVSPCRILAVVWVGDTQSGDNVSMHCPTTNRLLWKARTDANETYLGINVGVEGIPCPFGFKLSEITAGEVLVYLREN